MTGSDSADNSADNLKLVYLACLCNSLAVNNQEGSSHCPQPLPRFVKRPCGRILKERGKISNCKSQLKVLYSQQVIYCRENYLQEWLNYHCRAGFFQEISTGKLKLFEFTNCIELELHWTWLAAVYTCRGPLCPRAYIRSQSQGAYILHGGVNPWRVGRTVLREVKAWDQLQLRPPQKQHYSWMWFAFALVTVMRLRRK